MWALRKNPVALSGGQRTALAQIAADNKHLYKAYLMKEQLREVFKAKGERGKALLAGLIAWSQRCRIPEFTKFAKTLKRFRQLIWNTLDHAVSNGRAEGINTQLAALTARARGFPQRRRVHRHGRAHLRRPMPGSARTITKTQ